MQTYKIKFHEITSFSWSPKVLFFAALMPGRTFCFHCAIFLYGNLRRFPMPFMAKPQVLWTHFPKYYSIHCQETAPLSELSFAQLGVLASHQLCLGRFGGVLVLKTAELDY